MSEPVRPDQAARSLAEIRAQQEQVINVTVIPVWFWWLLGGLMVALAAAVESGDRLTIGFGVGVFVLGVLAATGWVVRRAQHVQPRNDLLGWRGVTVIVGFVALVVGASFAVALGLTAAGVAHPATLSNLLTAVMLIVGGPTLMRTLRRIMLDNRAGSTR